MTPLSAPFTVLLSEIREPPPEKNSMTCKRVSENLVPANYPGTRGWSETPVVSGLHLDVGQRPRAAGKNVAFLDFLIENAAIMVHLHFAGELQHPAGAADAGFAGSADAHASGARRHQHRLPWLAGQLLSGKRETHHRQRFAISTGENCFSDRHRSGGCKALLVEPTHIEAGGVEHRADGGHERFRPATEDGPVHEIGRQKRDLGLVDHAFQAGPEVGAAAFFDNKAERQVRHEAGEIFQLMPEDDIAGGTRTVDEGDVALWGAVAHIAHHRHHRRDAGTGRDEEIFVAGVLNVGEVAKRSERPDFHAGLQIVEHPARANAGGLRLDRDRKRIGPRRAGRQGIGAVERLRTHGQFQCDELARQITEPVLILGAEQKRHNVGCFRRH
ncbi:hypothetical protein AT6N2_C1741 [Agrobacterium tumefaciens]|nr:hypothetical protein AT6N2_C1741 [Agrobacterium tumefaciens]